MTKRVLVRRVAIIVGEKSSLRQRAQDRNVANDKLRLVSNSVARPLYDFYCLQLPD